MSIPSIWKNSKLYSNVLCKIKYRCFYLYCKKQNLEYGKLSVPTDSDLLILICKETSWSLSEIEKLYNIIEETNVRKIDNKSIHKQHREACRELRNLKAEYFQRYIDLKPTKYTIKEEGLSNFVELPNFRSEADIQAELYRHCVNKGLKVHLEVPLPSLEHSSNSMRADLAIFAGDKIVCVVEVKAPGTTNDNVDTKQLRSYEQFSYRFDTPVYWLNDFDKAELLADLLSKKYL